MGAGFAAVTAGAGRRCSAAGLVRRAGDVPSRALRRSESLRFSAFSSPSIRRRTAMSSFSAAAAWEGTSRTRLNNAGAARKTNGYTEQTRYQSRVVDFTVLVSAACQRRPDPATRSSRLPQIIRGPITLPQFDITHMVELTRLEQFRSGNQPVSASVSSVRPTTDKSPLNTRSK